MKKLLVCLVLFLMFGAAFLLFGQTSAYQAYLWVRQGNRFALLPLDGGFSTDGKTVTLTAPSERYTFGRGFTLTSSSSGTLVDLDSAAILYRVSPPSGPGPCYHGEGAIAADDSHIYTCVPGGSTGMRWARAPMELTWPATPLPPPGTN